IRNYTVTTPLYLLWPYSPDSATPKLEPTIKDYLKPWKQFLSERSQFHKTQLEAGLAWFEYREYHRKGLKPPSIGYSEIATHTHFLLTVRPVAFVQTAPVVRPLQKFEAS